MVLFIECAYPCNASQVVMVRMARMVRSSCDGAQFGSGWLAATPSDWDSVGGGARIFFLGARFG